MSRTLSIIIPCLNEERAVAAVLARAEDVRRELTRVSVSQLEVIVVDDASTDTSAAEVSKYPSVRILKNTRRLGYGGSLKRGIATASGELIAFYDMDHTYDPFDLISMIEELDRQNLQLVCGDRLSSCKNMPIMRHIGNLIFVTTIRFLFQQRVYDSCTGLRVLRRESRHHFLGDDLPNCLGYSLAMTMHCLSRGIPLGEKPIRYDKRIGRSKLSILVDGPRFFITILNHWMRYESRGFVRRLTSL